MATDTIEKAVGRRGLTIYDLATLATIDRLEPLSSNGFVATQHIRRALMSVYKHNATEGGIYYVLNRMVEMGLLFKGDAYAVTGPNHPERRVVGWKLRRQDEYNRFVGIVRTLVDELEKSDDGRSDGITSTRAEG